jgi:cytochrome c oxidase subunit 2
MRHLLRSITLCLLLLGAFTPEARAIIGEERTHNLYYAPVNLTDAGEKIDQILNFIFWLTLFVFVATQGVYIYYLVKYRRRPGHKAHYSHGNNTLEFWWTIIPTAIFLTLAIWGNRVWNELTASPIPEDAVTVDIVSYQYGWDFRYPGADGQLGESTPTGFTTENKFAVNPDDPAGKDDFNTTELVIPANRTVHVLLRSRDVIHSFYVPSFRLYQDAVPGRTIKWVHFTVKRPAELELACSQLCGTGHYNMKAKIRVLPEAEYEKWHAEKSQAALAALAGS